MKRFLETDRWDERSRLIAAATLTGAVLLFAMLFPLLFRQSAAPQPERGRTLLDVRADLFAQYWNAGDAAAALRVELTAPPDAQTAKRCEARMAEIVGACIVDRALENTVPTGQDYFSLSDGTHSVNICRMWLERKGDWRNWLDVCFDADSGEVYYLYLSCECLENHARYVGQMDAPARQLPALLAKLAQGEIRFDADGAAETQTLVISGEDGTVCYRVGGVAYEQLIDLKVSCF